MHTSKTSSNSGNSGENFTEYLEQVYDAIFNNLDIEMDFDQGGILINQPSGISRYSRKDILIGLSNGSLLIGNLLIALGLDIVFENKAEESHFQKDMILIIIGGYLDPKNQIIDMSDPDNKEIRKILNKIKGNAGSVSHTSNQVSSVKGALKKFLPQ